MSRYRCEVCGCFLDPGEKCDCLKQSEQLKKKYEQLTSVNNEGQVEIEYTFKNASKGDSHK